MKMRVRLTDIIDEADNIRTFRLRGDVPPKFVAGQWMYVRLTESLKHHFTISASPTEGFLQFTTKFREESEYKKQLWQLKIGDEVEINGNFGSFLLDEEDRRKRVFVAGGIGITPFRSQLKYIFDSKLDLDVTLIYSGKIRDEMAFASELESMNGQLNLKTFLVETEKTGRVNEETIRRLCPDWKERSLWLCGPPAMVEAFVELGQKMGFDSQSIKSEEFTGY